MALGSKERTLDDLPFYQVVWKIAVSFILMMPGLVLSDGGAERSEGVAVFRFVVGEEIVPAVVDELPKLGGAGPAGLVDGRHKNCT